MIIIWNCNVKKESKKWFDDDFQKEGKKTSRKLKAKKILRNTKYVGKKFVGGVAKQVVQPDTLLMGGLVGLIQGFKYSGNVKRGIVAGLITVGVMGCINGISNAAKGIDEIRKVDKK